MLSVSSMLMKGLKLLCSAYEVLRQSVLFASFGQCMVLMVGRYVRQSVMIRVALEMYCYVEVLTFVRTLRRLDR